MAERKQDDSLLGDLDNYPNERVAVSTALALAARVSAVENSGTENYHNPKVRKERVAMSLEALANYVLDNSKDLINGIRRLEMCLLGMSALPPTGADQYEQTANATT